MKLALLVPVFNNQKGFQDTLSSLNHLSIPVEIIVVDDGSSPALSTPKSYLQNSVHLVRFEKNLGIEEALNAGIRMAIQLDCDLIARLDAGDSLLQGRLEQQLRIMTQDTRIGIVGVHTQFVTPDGVPLYIWRPPSEAKRLRRFMHLQNPFVHSGVMYRTSIVEEAGYYRHDTPAAEDYDLFFRIAKISQVAMIPEVLMRCELNPKGVSLSRRKRQAFSLLLVRIRYFEPLVIESYLGLIRGIIAYLLPVEALTRVKNWLWK